MPIKINISYSSDLTGSEQDQLRLLQPLLESRLIIITNSSAEAYEWSVDSDRGQRRLFRLLRKFDSKLIYSGSMQDMKSSALIEKKSSSSPIF